jgi:hypothetical protein
MKQKMRLGLSVKIFILFVFMLFSVHAVIAEQSVDLGTAENFVILAKTGISTTGVTSITGDIGVSPAAATFITGFGLIMDASNQFSTSSLVDGNAYAADYTAPTPSVMTTAISDMETAYTTANGIAPDVTELGAGNIGGLTLVPGVYKWSTGVTIPTDLTLSGNSTDIWIFQIAQNLDINSATEVILAGGALEKNIFWVVAGQTTLGTTSVFNGNILDQTAIILNTGATLNGRALAQSAVTLDANIVTKPIITGPVFIDENVNGVLDSEEQSFFSIQSAIDAATAGNTIVATAGTYDERIIINKSLTLRGATYNINKNGYNVPENYEWVSESVINNPEPALTGLVSVVHIEDTNDVTFEGFVVQSLNAPQGSANDMLVTIQAKAQTMNNIIIKNNVIGPNTNNSGGQNGDAGRMGLYIDVNEYQESPYGLTNSNISGNKIFGTYGDGNAMFIWGAYYAYGSRNSSPMTGTIIEDNEINNGHRNGIEIAGGISNLVIRNNVIHNFSSLVTDSNPDLLKYGTGILLIRGSSDKTDCNGLSPENVTIENNQIYNNEKNAIYMGPNNNEITISNNTLHDNGLNAVIVDLIGNYWNPEFEIGPGPYTCLNGSENVSANQNMIYDNGEYGVRVIGEPTNNFVLDATNNYWGTNVESEIQALINGTVDYTPWYFDANMTSVTVEPNASETIFNSTDMTVNIPATTTIIGDSNWDGIVNNPSTKPNASVKPSTSGFTTYVSKVVEVGALGVKLTLNKAAKIVMHGETGKKVGYSHDGITFNKITTVCIDNTQVTNDLLPAGEDCYFDDGTNIIIWTKHFTEFVTYNETPISAVDLGTAGNFVILTKTGISTTGDTSVTGNIGVSPAAATFITGFGLIMDASNQFSTSSLVDGNVYASDYTAPTPTVMTTAISDMETAYTTANGIAPGVTELGAGNIGGLTLVPGVYKWSTGVTIPTDLTLSGNSTEIWIFQIAQDLDISSATEVILSGGAEAKNIFWIVAGQTTLGTTSVFNGNILDQTAIVLNTGATLNGRALAQTAVILDANNVSSPIVIATPVLTSITITPNTTTIIVGSTQQFNATGLDQFGLPMAAVISYDSSNLSVATVNATTGLVTTIDIGTATITASSDALNATSLINVEVAPPIIIPPTSTTSGGRSSSVCKTNWLCSEWTTCSDGQQTRTCNKERVTCYAGAEPILDRTCTNPEPASILKPTPKPTNSEITEIIESPPITSEQEIGINTESATNEATNPGTFSKITGGAISTLTSVPAIGYGGIALVLILIGSMVYLFRAKLGIGKKE